MEDRNLLVYEMGNIMKNTINDLIYSVATDASVTEENLYKSLTPAFIERIKESGYHDSNCTEWVEVSIQFSVNEERKEVYVEITPDFGDGREVYGEPEVFNF